MTEKQKTHTHNKKLHVAFELCGWYGAAAILTAYILSSFNIIQVDTIIYQILNLTGAVGIIIISIAKNVKQSALLNVVWATVAFVALVAIIIK